VHALSSAAGIKEASVDSRRRDALTSFSGWWRSWPLLAAGAHDGPDHLDTEPDLDESAHFAAWAAELAMQGGGGAGGADRG
jgi:hypothetical protein